MRWACLLLPQLAMDVVLRQHPNPDQPLALVEGPHARRRLHSVNAAARALGLRPGLSLVAAHAIADGVRTAEYDPQAAERARQLLAAWAYRYSSQVSTDFAHALVLEIAGSRRLFGAWPQLRQRLDAELRELGFRHRMAAAPNPFAARALTNIGEGLFFDDDLLLPALAKMPIERSGLDPATVQALQRMGLRKLGAVFALPRAAGAAFRPGSAAAPGRAARRGRAAADVLPAARRLRRAHRTRPRSRIQPGPAVPAAPPHRRPGRVPVRPRRRRGPVQAAARTRAPQPSVAAPAERNRGRPARAGARGGDAVRTRPRPPAARAAAGAGGGAAPARRGTAAVRAGRARPVRPAPAAGAAVGAVARAPARAARRRTRARARCAPRPPARTRLATGAGDAPAARGKHAATPAPTLPATRPGWLLAEPEPLREPVARILAGPERIESGWWDQDDVRRDYYLVETARGQRAWAYRDAGGDGPLIVHGWFA
nr:DNA polymerase Y family protein [Lysobacter enzymogenes]